jgi:hypothetical protein
MGLLEQDQERLKDYTQMRFNTLPEIAEYGHLWIKTN